MLLKEEVINKKARKQLDKIKETLELPHLKELQNASEDDAKIGHKSESNNFFGFKNHIAVTEDEQLITALVVTNGNEADPNYFEELIKNSIQNGVEIDEVLGDTAYSSTKDLEYTEKNEIKVISKLHPNVDTNEKNNEHIHFNKDANTFECVCGHLAKRNKPTQTGKIKFSFTVNSCKNCPHKNA